MILSNIAFVNTLINKNSFIESISSVSRNVVGLIKYIYQETDHSDIKVIFKNTDIEATITTLEYFVKDIPEKNEIDSLNIALSNLENILKELNIILTAIKDKIKNHDNKYFSSWRSISFKDDINILLSNIHVLNIRFDILVKILKLN